MRAVRDFAPDGATVQSAGQGSSAPKWQQLRAVEEAREALGLKATSINVLRAMLSFMSADRVSEMAPDHHVVYAGNAAIAQRAHVSVQTVERHIAKLVDLGIVQRVTAANGKRWCRRDSAGQVALVSGLSLLPLTTRHAEFTAVAAQYQRTQDALRVLKDECLLALARLQEVCCDGIQHLMDHARTILRRRPQQDVLQCLLNEINAAMPADNTAEEKVQPSNLRDGDIENEGHKEHSLNPDSKKRKSFSISLTQDDMERSFPALCAELRFARNNEEGLRMMDDIARQLRLGQAWWKCKEMGPAISFIFLGYILERVDSVQNHQSYLVSMMGRLEAGEVEPEQLVRPL